MRYRSVTRWAGRFALLLILLLAGPAGMFFADDRGSQRWHTASRASAGLAPDPAVEHRAVVQVYAARTFGWRGAFAVHSWVVTKARGADRFIVHDVVGWRHGTKIGSRPDTPDRHWYGAPPMLLADLRGEAAERAISQIVAAIAAYPYRDRYAAWPGPNSNTFVAWIGRQVPALRLDLPPTAIGKDFLVDGAVADASVSGTGFQVSLWGLLGLTLATEEGIEANILGLGFGVDPLDLALRLPGLGRLGL